MKVELDKVMEIVKENFKNGQAICCVLAHEFDKIAYGKVSGKKIYLSDYLMRYCHADNDDVFCNESSNWDNNITIDNLDKIAVPKQKLKEDK